MGEGEGWQPRLEASRAAVVADLEPFTRQPQLLREPPPPHRRRVGRQASASMHQHARYELLKLVGDGRRQGREHGGDVDWQRREQLGRHGDEPNAARRALRLSTTTADGEAGGGCCGGIVGNYLAHRADARC